MGGARHRSGWDVVLVMTAALSACVLAGATTNPPTVADLKARVPSVNVGERPQLCLQIAERQLIEADKLYAALESEKAEATLGDVVSFSEMARDYSLQAHKHQKQTEITVRKMARRLAEIKHTVSHDEQAGLQNAINRLEHVRDDLLFSMFPKKAEK
jgi:hypothetical protein